MIESSEEYYTAIDVFKIKLHYFLVRSPTLIFTTFSMAYLKINTSKVTSLFHSQYGRKCSSYNKYPNETLCRC